jgi:hypothetical protein
MPPKAKTAPGGAPLDALLLALLAACLRFYHLGSQPLWIDEYYTWRWVSQGSLLSDVLHILVVDIYPPLFQVFTWASTRIDDSAFWLRFWSALGGVAATLLTWSIVRRRFGRAAALAAGLAAAWFPLGVYYAQEAKLYSFFAAVSLWMLDEFLRLHEEADRSWGRLALATAASLYTCYLAPFLIAPLFLAAGLVWKRRPLQARRLALGLLAGGLAALPLLPFFLKGVASFRDVQITLGRCCMPWYSAQNFSLGFWADERLAWLAAGLCLLGLALAWLRGPRGGALRVLVLFAALPPLLNWLVTLKQPAYSDRALLGGGYAWLAAAVLGLFTLPRRPRWALLGLLLALQAAAVYQYHAEGRGQRQDFEPAYVRLKQLWRPGDTVFHFSGQSLYPFKFYAYREMLPMPNWMEIPEPGIAPAAEGYRAAWRRFKPWLAQRGLPIDAGMEKSRVWSPRLEEEALKGAGRLWYVQMDADTQQRVWDPHLNVSRNHFKVYETFQKDPLNLAWLKANGFRFTRKEALAPGFDAYLFERKLP